MKAWMWAIAIGSAAIAASAAFGHDVSDTMARSAWTLYPAKASHAFVSGVGAITCWRITFGYFRDAEQ